MNPIAKLYFCFLIYVTESFYLHDGRAMPTRKADHFLISARPDGYLPLDPKSMATDASSKHIILIRHGQTYMNELIGGCGITFGQPNFTDVFPDPEDQKKYHDSPLSDVGTQQARLLHSKLQDLRDGKDGSSDNFLDSLDLVVVSPLTRALQTLELSLYGHIVHRNNEGGNSVPILAVAAAAERLYLVSDLGKSRSELRSNFPFVDFDTAFLIECADKVESSSGSSSNEDERLDIWHYSPTTAQLENECSEWRPHGEGQQYACLGEPIEHFDRRMSNFYYWLESREEKCIAVVCHAGVIDWMTSGEQFANCELRVQTFDSLRPRALQERVSQSY